MPSAAAPAHTSTLTLEEDPGPEHSVAAVRKAFARAAQELQVSVGPLERFLPDWAECPEERVAYEKSCHVICRRIVEILQPGA